MSFSQTVKKEIIKKEALNKVAIKTELAAMARMNGTIELRGFKDIVVRFVTESNPVIRYIFKSIKTLYNYEPIILIKKNEVLKRRNNYFIYIEDAKVVDEFLNDIGLIFNKDTFDIEDKLPESLIKTKDLKKIYLRGSFIGGGYITNPQKNYHLELYSRQQAQTERIIVLLKNFKIQAKFFIRGDNYIVYIRDSEKIIDFLNIIGAHTSLLEFTNVKTLKEIRNSVNRLVNCETANINKTVNAAVKQIEFINYIKKKNALDMLDDPTKKLAELRLKYRQATLSDLGEMLNPSVGKSGVRHRFMKIEKLAKDLGLK